MGNIIVWIIIGLLAGFLVSLFFPTVKGYVAGTLVSGIVGSFVGGMVYSALKTGSIARNIDPVSFAVAVIGAGILLFLINVLISSDRKQQDTS